MTVEIAPRVAGCELTLTHEGVLPDHAERATQGWTTMLGGIAAALGEGADAGALTQGARAP